MSRVERTAAAFALAFVLSSSVGFAAPKAGAKAGTPDKSASEKTVPEKSGDGKNGNEKLRPTGPVKINADRAEWQKGGTMVYTGSVRLESGDLKLSGDRLNLRQFDDGQFEAKIDGKPAMLDHAGLAAVGSKDNERPPVSARASQLTYDSREEVVVIDGDALLTRGTDEIRGQNIRYDVAERRIEAQGKEGCDNATSTPGDAAKPGCQVEIVIQPPPRKGKTDGAPAPAPQGSTP
jgi:lipopolysaccharide transport protein LptA